MIEQLDGISVVVGILIGVVTVVAYVAGAAFVDLLTDVEDEFDAAVDQALVNAQEREATS